MEEIGAFRKQFDTLYDENIESPYEYMKRKRNRDMRTLIVRVVEDELDGVRRDVFERVFFCGEKIADIALSSGISLSAVYKHYDKALKTVGSCLKYVLLYQNVCTKDVMMPLQKMRDGAFAASKRVYPHAFALRLSRLMERENISPEKLCKALMLDEIRFGKISRGKTEPLAGEIVLISGFFGVSADYILKGDVT